MRKPSKTVPREAFDDVTKQLHAYQEAFWALRRGEKPIKLTVAAGTDMEHTIEALALSRACGGVVLDGPGVTYASEWCMRAIATGDAYRRELARFVEREVERANHVSRPGELAEMRDMLTRHDRDPALAEKLAADGIGPFELAQRLIVPKGQPSSVEWTHGKQLPLDLLASVSY